MQNLVWLGAFVTLSCDSPHFQIEYYIGFSFVHCNHLSCMNFHAYLRYSKRN
jgi:hypothetical protein